MGMKLVIAQRSRCINVNGRDLTIFEIGDESLSPEEMAAIASPIREIMPNLKKSDMVEIFDKIVDLATWRWLRDNTKVVAEDIPEASPEYYEQEDADDRDDLTEYLTGNRS